MSVKTTVILTREKAIDIIVKKDLEPAEKHLKRVLQEYSNKELEGLMDSKYYRLSEFENYSIVEENKGDE